MMASIKKRDDGRWRARYRDPDGKEHARHFARKFDAERWLDGVRGELVTGAYIDPNAGKLTVRQYAEEWRMAQVHRVGTQVRVDGHFRLHVYPTLGHRQLRQVRPTEIQAWVRALHQVLSPRTVDNVYRYLSAVFAAAVADGLIRSNPCHGTKLAKAPPRQIVPLEVSHIRAIADAAPDRYRAAIITGAGTGLRLGELLGLDLERVDFLRRRITVDRQLVEQSGLGSILTPPKTRASYRTVPAPDLVLEALAEHLATYPPEPGGLIFTNAHGAPVRHNRFGDMWRAAVKRADLRPARTSTRPHDLRHHYASLLIHHGESVTVVQARLGHATAAETLNTYAHLWPDSEDRTRQAVDELLGAAFANLADYTRTSASG